MTKIDTRGWKEFKLTDIFRMNNTKSIVQKDVVPDSGTIPYVTAQAGNNGVMTYIDCPAEWLDEGECIMIGGKTLTFSYQEQAFCSNDSHNIALHLKDADKASEVRYLFLIAALRGSLHQKYSWGDSISMKTIKDDVFRLPVDASCEPDWAYMDEYMSAVMKESEESLESLRQADGERHVVDTSEWQDFRIGDLFEISRPVARSQAKYEDGNVPFVASGNFNNGVTKWCAPKDGEVLDAGNCITVSPLDGSAFYQAMSFLGRGGAGSAILMLRNISLTELSGLFISSVIRRSLTKYTYSDQLNSKTIEDESIRLPVDASGEPDWAYMDEYMLNIMNNANSSINKLRKI